MQNASDTTDAKQWMILDDFFLFSTTTSTQKEYGKCFQAALVVVLRCPLLVPQVDFAFR